MYLIRAMVSLDYLATLVRKAVTRVQCPRGGEKRYGKTRMMRTITGRGVGPTKLLFIGVKYLNEFLSSRSEEKRVP